MKELVDKAMIQINSVQKKDYIRLANFLANFENECYGPVYFTLQNCQWRVEKNRE